MNDEVRERLARAQDRALGVIGQLREPDAPITWKQAAHLLGEQLASCGPDGYYKFSPNQWLEWALKQI